MMTVSYYMTRKQIVVEWEKEGDRETKCFPRTERGRERANKKINELRAEGYALAESRQNWFSSLLDAAQKAKQ